MRVRLRTAVARWHRLLPIMSLLGKTAAWTTTGRAVVAELGLTEAICVLREELEQAVSRSDGQQIRFLIGPVEMEFHVGVRREGGATGKARFWVLEAGTEGRYARETVQRVSITLQAVDDDGQPIRVQRGYVERP
jgi:Trypsin-co-occurring domain 2